MERSFWIGGRAIAPRVAPGSSSVSFLVSMVITLLLYAALGGAYLLVMPVAILFYLQQRWYIASSIERVLMYFMVFFFFPGLLVLSPFVNLRPQKRQLS